jgi:hypothetical protein
MLFRIVSGAFWKGFMSACACHSTRVNQVFKVNAFATGLPVGTATVTSFISRLDGGGSR